MAMLDDAAADLQQTVAALQRELDQCTAERDEALAREAALAEVLHVINSSPGDPTPVFDAILEKAHTLCGATLGSLVLYDGERLRAVATRGYPEEYAALARKGGPAHMVTAIERLLRGERLVHVPDAAVLTTLAPLSRAGVEIAGIRTALFVPLRKDGALLGYVSAQRQEVRPFSEREIALLESFAAQAVIAMENARLITETREALEQQTATAEVLQVINSSPGDLAPVFDAMLEKALRLCEAAHGHIWRIEGQHAYAVALRGDSQFIESMRQESPAELVSERPLGRIARGEHVVHMPDATKEEAYRTNHVFREFIDASGIRTGVMVALRKDEALLGAIVVHRKEVLPFSDKQIALLQNFADQAVIAMENARLITETRRSNLALRENEERYALVTQAVAEGIYEWNIQSNSLWVSSRLIEIFGLAERGLTAADWNSLVHPEDFPLYRSALRACFKGVTPRLDCEYRVRHSDGGYRWIEDRGVPIRDAAGWAVRMVGALTDISSRKEADEGLREALDQQTATAQILEVINRSPGNLAPVFEAMVERAVQLCEADEAAVRSFDGKLLHLVAAHGEPDVLEKLRELGPSDLSRPGGLYDPFMRGERVVHIADVRETETFRNKPIARKRLEVRNIRTWLAVALRRESKLLGVINVHRHEVRPFSEKQIALLENFAAQAVIAMENARLLSETREALEQQTATAEVLGVINSSPGDLAPVFEAILDKAHTLCGATLGSLFLFDGELFRAAAVHGYPEDLARHLREGVVLSAAPQLLDDSVRWVHNPDLTLIHTPTARAVSGRGGVRTNLMLPLRKDGRLLGAISCNRQEVRPFTDKEIALLENFAAQAVIAMENARLLGELHARTDELTRSVAELQTLEEVLRAVNSSLDLDTVLATIVARAAQLSQADEGTIYEFDETEEVFVPKSAFGMSGERVEALRERRIKLGETHLGRSALLRAPVYVQDVQQDPSVPYAARTLPGIHAVLAVPLLRDDKVVGGLVIRRRTEAGFAPTIPTLLQTFAGQAVLAIENARLFQEARRARTAAEAALADLHRAQDRLIQAEKMASLGQLTAGIAHEIKNPLNFVNNFAGLSVELLEELKETAAPAIAGLAEDERADVDEIVAMLTGNLEKIAEHGRRADGIVKSMLEHSRGGSGERREVDLNGLVEEALNLAYHGARAQDQSFNITLERNLDHALAPVELVPQDMTRVFLNLFGNGFYAATKRRRGGAEPDFRPALKVATYDLGEAVEIRIRDNGTGIAPEIRDKLFQPFFTTKPTGEGTGLGLSISWDIVTQQHGGTIEVDSRVGEFTEFRIRLPRSRPAATPVKPVRYR